MRAAVKRLFHLAGYFVSGVLMDGAGAWTGPAGVAGGMERAVLSGHIAFPGFSWLFRAFPATHVKRRATYLIHPVTQGGAVSSKLFS